MAAVLRKYLSAAAKRGFQWGEYDCFLFAAGWAWVHSGADPMSRWRGMYRTEAEAKTIVARLGGISACMGTAMWEIGWRTVSVVALEPGDVVMVALPGGTGEHVAGVAVGGRKVALLTAKGLVVAPAHVLRAWRWQARHG